MLPFHSRKEPQRRRERKREGKCARHEIREMMLSVSTPSAAIRTKRIARNPPPHVHDDDRKDDFVAKMYFADDIDGGIELDWCISVEGADMRMERWNGRRTGWFCRRGKGNHLLHFETGRAESLFTRAFVYFLSEAISSSAIFFFKIDIKYLLRVFSLASESACE